MNADVKCQKILACSSAKPMHHLTPTHNHREEQPGWASISHLMKSKLRREVLSCESHPLLITGGEVGDMEGHARLTGGGSGGGGGESCPSSSEELSSVKSITSTFLPLLLSMPPWLDDDELRWSEPADVRQDPAEQNRDVSLCLCTEEKKNKRNNAHPSIHIPLLLFEIEHTYICYYGDAQFTQWR